jgi:drug/metabolite transporter (DMT)-like permease
VTRSTIVGIGAAVTATFVWSLNFIVPFVIEPYSIWDFALMRFAVAGLMCAAFVASRRHSVLTLTLQDWLVTFWLGVIGCVAYFFALVGAAMLAGPVIPPAIIGPVPVVLAIAGNIRQRVLPWRTITIPLGFVTVGLLLIHWPVGNVGPGPAPLEGVVLAITAVALWTWFGLLNQSALMRRPTMNAGIWTALIIVGAGLGMLAFAPIAYRLGLFRMTQLGLSWRVAAPLYLWSIALALSASIGGALAWTIAARRLPVSLAAQLVVMEAVFGTVLGLIVHRRWPTIAEATGVAVLIAGVVAAIRVFERQRLPLPATA